MAVPEKDHSLERQFTMTLDPEEGQSPDTLWRHARAAAALRSG
jgi:hypothetical protein